MWLSSHPEMEVVSRDRARNYADAAREAVPQALQVADRFHLVKNIRGKRKEVVDRNRGYLPFVNNPAPASASSQEKLPGEHNVPDGAFPCLQEKETHQAPEQGSNPSEEGSLPRTLTVSQQRRQLNRDKRDALYEKVKD